MAVKVRFKVFPLRINSSFKLEIRRQNSLISVHLYRLNLLRKSKMVKKAVKVMITRVSKKFKSCQIVRTIGCRLCARLMCATKRQISSQLSTSKETL